jgi:hypothetical protein
LRWQALIESRSMQKFDEAAYRDFAEALRERVAAYAPEWTGGNDSDPGVTLVELFAFLTESLLYRAGLIPERGHGAAIRLAQSALMLAGPSKAAPRGTLERPRYFAGQLLGPDDFTLEQDYFRMRLRRLNRALYGSGIANGLGVSVKRAGAGEQVVIESGFAIDASGEEIEVSSVTTADLPQTGGVLYVLLLHCGRPTHPQSTAAGTQFSRIEESFAVRLEAAATGNGVALARLRLVKGRWRVDAAFKPPRRP